MACPNCGYIDKNEDKEIALVKKIVSLGAQQRYDELNAFNKSQNRSKFDIEFNKAVAEGKVIWNLKQAKPELIESLK